MKLLLLASAILTTVAVLEVQSVAVVCYYSSWAAWDGITPEDFNVSLCTHINYAFITLWEDGDLRVEDEELDIGEGLYKRVTDLKKTNPNLKVSLSIGGDAAGELFRGMIGNALRRRCFVDSATYFIAKYNFDGCDIDFEYPEEAEKDNYILLLKELKAAFEPKGWLLTAAVSSDIEHGYIISEMIQYLDFINLMTYDFYGSWSNYTGQNSALYASSVEDDWEKNHLNIIAAANNWVNAGLPKNKLAVGTAFYGRSFTLSDPNNHGLRADITGVGKDGEEASYAHICSMYDNWTRIWDDEQKNPYRYSGDQWIGYDDQESILKKAIWIKKNGFFGVMIWSIDQDDIFGICGEKQTLLKQINKAIA